MNLYNFRIISGFLFVMFVTNSINAQETEKNASHNEQVTIISSFDPSINQAFKINSSPDEMMFNIEKPEFTYESLNITLPTNIKLEPIKPVVINADKRTTTYNNSLKVGAGSLFSPLVDFFHTSGNRSDYNFSAHIYQLSSFKNIKDYSPSPELLATADIDYRKYLRNHIIDAGLRYSINSNRYYGFKPDDYSNVKINDNQLKQMTNLAEIDINFKSNYKNSNKLTHEISLNSYYFTDRHKTSETFANIGFDLHKSFDLSDMIDFQELGITAGYKYYGNRDSLVTTNDMLISTTPYFTGKYGIINFYIGLNFNYLSTTTSKFYFYPVIDAAVVLIPDYLTVFAGVKGNVYKNSFFSMYQQNPWISSTIKLNWDRMFIAVGGIRGNFYQKVNYSAQLSWKKFNNMFFFVNTEDGTNGLLPFNKFDAVYDGGSVFGINGEVSYAASEKVNFSAGVKFNTYSLDSLKEAYHKPSSEIKIGLSVLVAPKIKIWTEGFYYGKRVALDPTLFPLTNSIDLDPFIDLNAGVEYKLSNKFGVFLTITNILNSDYQRYLNYPVHGIQIMGGFSYKF